jgi:hypothetical protein
VLGSALVSCGRYVLRRGWLETEVGCRWPISAGRDPRVDLRSGAVTACGRDSSARRGRGRDDRFVRVGRSRLVVGRAFDGARAVRQQHSRPAVCSTDVRAGYRLTQTQIRVFRHEHPRVWQAAVMPTHGPILIKRRPWGVSRRHGAPAGLRCSGGRTHPPVVAPLSTGRSTPVM